MMKVLHRVISLVLIIFFAVLPKTAFAHQCDVHCSISYDDPTCYSAEGSCTWCYHVCRQPDSTSACTQDATCWGAITATKCNLPGYSTIGSCSMPSCGTPCTDDRTCKGAANSCNTCVHGHCGQVVPTCETACYSDEQCIGASQCTSCRGGVCALPPVPTCGTACYSDEQCIGASQCTSCTDGVCELPLFPQSCISDADGLSKAALGSSNQITLCLNSKITLSSTIHLDRFGQDITLSCIGSCSIVGTNMFPLMVVNANTVKITGIEFTLGKSNDNGGAISLTAKLASFDSCTFNSNTALLKGGAIFSSGGQVTFTNCKGTNNQAAQCTDVFLTTSGSCGIFT